VDSTPGNEIILEFTPSGPGDDLAENDLFYVQARSSWTYNGNGEDLSVHIGKGNTAAYNVSGEEAFTDRGRGEVDLFAALETLKTALENGDRDLVNEQVNRLTAAQDHIREQIASVGARMSGLNISKENYQVLDEKMSGLISDTEDVDLEAIIVEFQMRETALRASYAMAVEIGKKSILDFLT
jgi:flagellar hook-associated protein 3 FlgL